MVSSPVPLPLLLLLPLPLLLPPRMLLLLPLLLLKNSVEDGVSMRLGTGARPTVAAVGQTPLTCIHDRRIANRRVVHAMASLKNQWIKGTVQNTMVWEVPELLFAVRTHTVPNPSFGVFVLLFFSFLLALYMSDSGAAAAGAGAGAGADASAAPPTAVAAAAGSAPPSADGGTDVSVGDVPCRLFFLGTGTSEGVPRLSCLASAGRRKHHPCTVCADAMRPGSKNHRYNTGAVIVTHPGTADARVIAVDVGKLNWPALLDLFAANPETLTRLDAVVLTHEHADAAGGLDSLRDFTMNWWVTDGDGDEEKGKHMTKPLPIYLTARTFGFVKTAFSYMVTAEPEAAPAWAPGAAVDVCAAYVRGKTSEGHGGLPTFRFMVFEEGRPGFSVCGLPVVGFPVHHGGCMFTACVGGGHAGPAMRRRAHDTVCFVMLGGAGPGFGSGRCCG